MAKSSESKRALNKARTNKKKLGPRLSHRAKTTYANRDWLTERVTRGLSDPQITKEAGIGHGSIKYWRGKFGLKSQARREYLSPQAKKTYANRDWILEQRKLGLTQEQMARAAKCSVPCLIFWIRRFKLQVGHLSLSAQQTYANKHWLKKQFAAGQRDADIARVSGRHRGSIQVWRKRFGIKLPEIPKSPKKIEERLAIGAWLKPHLASANLDERKRDVLTACYGIGRPVEKLKTIAERYGLKKQRIEQIAKGVAGRIVASVPPEERGVAWSLEKYARKPAKSRIKCSATYGNEKWLRERVKRGATDAEIAREVGRATGTIAYWRKCLGVFRRKNHLYFADHI